MKIRNPFHFLYGLVMGTSVELLKPKRPLLPIRVEKISESLTLFLGADKNIGFFEINNRLYLLNRKIVSLNKSQRSKFAEYFKNKELLELTSEAETTRIEGVFQDEQKIINLANEKVVFVDDLFFHDVHPIFSSLGILDLDLWISALEKIAKDFNGYKIVPAEGAIANSKDVLRFAQYLKDLNTNAVSYESLMKNYGHFKEIVGITSVARNMDVIRGNPEWR